MAARPIDRHLSNGLRPPAAACALGEIFSDPNFATKVLAQMSVMKGREFPGFLNSQIFYGFMVRPTGTLPHWPSTQTGGRLTSLVAASGLCDVWCMQVQNVETWRPSVEVCRVQLVACLRGICTEVS